MKTCQNCGGENDDAAKFCESCGEPLQVEERTDIPQDHGTETPAPSQPVGEWDGTQAGPEFREAVPERKKSRKGLWIGLGSGLGVLAVVAVTLVILFLNNPLRKVVSAAQKTGQAWSREMESLENVRTIRENLDSLTAARACAQEFSLRVPVDAGADLYLDLGVDYDLPSEQVGIDFMLGVDGTGELRSQSYLNSEKFCISLPQIWPDQLLCFREEDLAELDTLGDEPFSLADVFAESPSADLMQEYQAACGQELKGYTRSLKLTEIRRSQENGRAWTYYQLVSDPEKKRALLDSTAQFLKESDYAQRMEALSAFGDLSLTELIDEYFETMAALQDPIVAVDERGYLVCLEMTDGTDTVSFCLTGDENPWHTYCVRNNGEEILTGSIQVDERQLRWENTLTAYIMGEAYTVSFTYDDASGAYDLRLPDGRTPVAGSLLPRDGGVSFAVTVGIEDITGELSLELGRLETAPKMPQGEEVDFMKLSARESEELSAAAVEALFSDAELMGLLNFFFSMGADSGF